MTIILFLIDTSASMNQRTFNGHRPTLLDVAKDTVEKFLKIRQRDPASRGDRYMLLNFDEYPLNIKAGWKENHNVFINELKNLNATGMTRIGPAIKNCFDLLNLNRMQTGIDTYGQGRSPYYLESAMIILITDGSKTVNHVGVQKEIILPTHSVVPGSELTKEPYRWDQRLFSIVLRLSGTPSFEPLNGPSPIVPPDNSPIDSLCELTGGRSFSISSQRSLNVCIESIISKIHNGVIVKFEKVGPDPPIIIPNEEEIINGCENGVDQLNNSSNKPTWHSCSSLIYVQRAAQKGYAVGHWPIPECFWPDGNTPTLQPRSSHPVIKFMCTPSDPMMIDNLPFDKYELEASPLTQYILSRKQPSISWQCFVANSHKSSELGYPFGYLKASTNLSCVNLFVLPYNYPTLLPILDEFFRIHHCKPTREWKISFENYVKNTPLYYGQALKRCLQRMGVPQCVIDNMDNMDNGLSYSVLNYIKRIKNQAKVDFDKLVASIGVAKPILPDTIKVVNATKKISEIINFNSPIFKSRQTNLLEQMNEFHGFAIRVQDNGSNGQRQQSYRNPYDISRDESIHQIRRMRINFLRPPGQIKVFDDDQLHSLPVLQMGNYQDYLKRMPTPLRELESTPARQHIFGNPFKIEKKVTSMMIDEADIEMLNNSAKGNSTTAVPIRKRRGPLPKDFQITIPFMPKNCPLPDERHIKRELFKLVRTPGNNYDTLIKELFRYSSPLRQLLMNAVIKEAQRFRRKKLIDVLNSLHV